MNLLSRLLADNAEAPETVERSALCKARTHFTCLHCMCANIELLHVAFPN